MSGKDDRSSASCVDLSRRDFRAMMYYDYCHGKSFQQCFQSLKHCSGGQSILEPLFSGTSDSSCLERERLKMMTVVVKWQ